MYSSKAKVWIITIIIVLVLDGIVACVSNGQQLFPDYNVYVESSDISLISKISDIDALTNFPIVSDIDNADIVILPRDDEKQLDGFKKYSRVLYTPIVMYVWDANDNESGFRSEQGVAFKDFKTILEAFEENKTYEDIGINEKSLSGTIQLAIPNKNDTYYNMVVDLFYIALNNNTLPTDEERTELKERVDALLLKCTKLEDVKTTIAKLYDDGDKNNPKDTIFIAPETIAFNSGTYAFFSSNNPNYDIVYTHPTIAYQFDIYIRSDDNHDASAIYEDLCKSKFQYYTGYRIVDHEKKLYSNFNHVAKTIKIVNW